MKKSSIRMEGSIPVSFALSKGTTNALALLPLKGKSSFSSAASDRDHGELYASTNRTCRRHAKSCRQYVQPSTSFRSHARSYSHEHHGHLFSGGPDKTNSRGRLGPHFLSPEYGIVRSSLALESERKMERSLRKGLLCWRRQPHSGNDPPFLWLLIASSRGHTKQRRGV